MKAPDLGRRGYVDNSPLISCEGVRERHLSSTQYPWTVGVCAKLLIRLKKAGPDQIPASWFRQQRLHDLQKWCVSSEN